MRTQEFASGLLVGIVTASLAMATCAGKASQQPSGPPMPGYHGSETFAGIAIAANGDQFAITQSGNVYMNGMGTGGRWKKRSNVNSK